MTPHHLYRRWRFLRGRLRGLRTTLFIRACGGSVGRRLVVESPVTFRQLPSHNWHLGDDVVFGCGVILDVSPSATLRVGHRVKFMHHAIVAAHESVSFGDDSGLSEMAAVRDAEHRIEPGDVMNTSQLLADPVSIGDGAAILRGSVVLAGVQVGPGAIVGANSVVTRDIPAQTIAVGAPARPTRSRQRGT